MVNLVKLTDKQGRSVFINPAHVAMVRPHNSANLVEVRFGVRFTAGDGQSSLESTLVQEPINAVVVALAAEKAK